MRVALYQPDIPQNTGTILRLCACLDVGVDIIEPAGFDMTSRTMKRAGLDYLDAAKRIHHSTFTLFKRTTHDNGSRVILLSTRGETPYHHFTFAPTDTLLLGRESAGVPDIVHDSVDARVNIPIGPSFRSLNVAVALAMVLGEALRQTGGFSSSA